MTPQASALPRPHAGQPSADDSVAALPTWALALPVITLLLQSSIYLLMDPSPAAPLDCGYLSLLCLTPWLVFLALARRLGTVLLGSYATGAAFYLINTNYLYSITLAGYLALVVYYGAFYALFGAGVWYLHRRGGFALTLAVPLLWVMTEYLRSLGPVALPLLFLSHALYGQIVLIQISDLTGALGLSFVVAMINGLAADVILRFLPGSSSRTRLPVVLLATAVVVTGTALYGVLRLKQDTQSAGPRVAVVQGDYPLTVEGTSVRAIEKREVYHELMDLALREEPDLLLLPETPWAMILNDEFLQADKVRNEYDEAMQSWSRDCDQRLETTSRENGVYLVIGAASLEYYPHAVYPKYKKYNSAYVYDPGRDVKSRYDKVTLVMFGEYTPFRGGKLHWLYRQLDSFNPFSSPDDEFSLTPGTKFRTFQMNTADGATHHFGIPICYEDLMPQIGRAFSVGKDGRKRVDFLLSISNDGWFNHGAAVPQHLAVCAFRAVENRVGIARSVNTACSGFIDPNGRMHDLVQRNGRILGRGIFDYSVAAVQIDPRVTLYSRYGDWFGVLCVLLSGVSVAVATLRRSRHPCAG